jgi:hypothetical protein
MPNSPERYSSFEVPTRQEPRKNAFEVTADDYPRGNFEVHEFDLSSEADRELYQELMNRIYSDKKRFFDIRRETYNFEFSRFVRVEFFEVDSKKEKKPIKTDDVFKDLIAGALSELNGGDE